MRAGDSDPVKLEAIRSIGVTRLSLGVENFDDEILQENGRAHVSKEIYGYGTGSAPRSSGN